MPKSENKMTANQTLQVLTAIADRAMLASRMGLSYGGKRDIYEALGYQRDLKFIDYMARYDRDPVAGAIIDEPVDACWSEFPDIIESTEPDDTEFEIALGELVERLKLLSVFSRADRLACIGQYSVLLLGFDDGADLSTEAKKAKTLLYITPYSEDATMISTYDTDTKSPRYGLPLTYQIKIMLGVNTTITKSVHHSRVIHIAEGCLENSLLGTPKLKRSFNYLQSLETVAGGSGEMFWRGAFPGYLFKTDPGTILSEPDKEKFKENIEKLLHGLSRYISGKNITAESLAQQFADPSSNIDKLIDLIACGARMPKRILLGSERGELASSQDERAYREQIKRRRQLHCGPVILRPTIDRLIAVKVLPAPKTKYSESWSDLLASTEKEKAEVANLKTTALTSYANSAAEQFMPFDLFAKMILALTDEQIELIAATVADISPDLKPDSVDQASE